MCQLLPLIKEYSNIPYSESELNTKEVINIIRDLPRISLITFTGGEPTTRRDLFEILTYASKKNKIHLVTNGTLLNQEKVMN